MLSMNIKKSALCLKRMHLYTLYYKLINFYTIIRNLLILIVFIGHLIKINLHVKLIFINL